MSETEALEVASVRSLASGGLDPTQFWTRPIVRRTIPPSAAALVGGGGQPRPGEVCRWPRMACCFWMNCPSSSAKRWTCREPLETGR